MLFPERFILLSTLRRELFRPSQRRERAVRVLLKHLQLLLRPAARLVDTVHLDAVRRAGHMQAPVPGGAHAQRLCVQRIVPAAANDLDPTFDIAWQIDLPRAPRPLVLCGHELQRDSVPREPSVGRQFDSLRPAAASGVGPAFAVDGSVVDDDLVVPR